MSWALECDDIEDFSDSEISSNDMTASQPNHNSALEDTLEVSNITENKFLVKVETADENHNSTANTEMKDDRKSQSPALPSSSAFSANSAISQREDLKPNLEEEQMEFVISSMCESVVNIVSDSKNAEFIHAAQSMLGVSATAHIEPKLSHILKSLVRSYNATKKYSHKKAANMQEENINKTPSKIKYKAGHGSEEACSHDMDQQTKSESLSQSSEPTPSIEDAKIAKPQTPNDRNSSTFLLQSKQNCCYSLDQQISCNHSCNKCSTPLKTSVTSDLSNTGANKVYNTSRNCQPSSQSRTRGDEIRRNELMNKSVPSLVASRNNSKLRLPDEVVKCATTFPVPAAPSNPSLQRLIDLGLV